MNNITIENRHKSDNIYDNVVLDAENEHYFSNGLFQQDNLLN